MLTLHGFAATRASRCLWMLHEIGAQFAHVPTPVGPAGTGSDAFAALNPNRRIPVLVDGDLVVWDSLAINLHLAETRGGDLGPGDASERARMTMWTLFAAGEFEPFAHEVYVNTITRPEPSRDPVALADAIAGLARPLTALSESLGSDGALVGGRFTVADLNVACIAFYLRGAPVVLADYPVVEAWYARATDRPAFRKMLELRAAAAAA